MSNALQVLTNPEFGDFRVVEIGDEPWWVFVDICKILGLSDPIRVWERLDDNEKLTLTLRGSVQTVTVVNESGLYNVIIQSDHPIAQEFKHRIGL